MEIVTLIIVVLVVSTPFLEKLSKVIRSFTNLIKQLQSNNSKRLLSDGRDLRVSLSVGSRNKKRNSCRKHKSQKSD